MTRRLRRAALVLLAAIALPGATLLANAWRLPSRQLPAANVAAPRIDLPAAAVRLADALKFRTVSAEGPASHGEFRKLHDHLQRSFPRVHASLERETIAGLSLLYTWRGSDPRLEPILLMAHQDVVPAEASAWKGDPFAGEVRDGFIWGRGAWDNKSALLAQMEAVELLLAQGVRPARTIYLAYGHDEELQGFAGAREIARVLSSRGVRLHYALDEGLVVTDGVLPGLPRPAALVGVAEKGYATVVLRAPGTPGHSLMPPTGGRGAIPRLASALRRLEEEQMPGAIRGVTREMFETLAPEMGGVQRVALSNLWLTGPLLQAQLARGAVTNAMVRTTTAATLLKAGVKENVLPASAEATLNFRIFPGDTRADVERHVREVAGEGYEVALSPEGSEPSLVSPTGSAAWREVAGAVRAAFPDALVAPGLVLGGTDARHYAALTASIYRFSPVRVRPGDADRIHGANERLGLENYGEMIRFFHALLAQAGPAAADPR